MGAKRALEGVLRIDPRNKKAIELLQQVEKMMNQSVQMQVQFEGGAGQTDLRIQSKGK